MKLKLPIYLLVVSGLSGACTDLSEELYDRVQSADYGQTPAEIETIVGRAYSSLRGGSSDGVHFYPTGEFVFFVSAVSSDECVIPTRVGGDWYDDGVYLDLHRHTWKADNPKLWAPWKYGYNGIASTNAIIYQVEQSGLDAAAARPLYAELKALRAYYYYQLLDWYGNVPLDTTYLATEAPGTSPRSEVFSFIERELKASIDHLPQQAYGRFTQDAANLLLARLYLNAEVYTGTARWQDCLTACGRISGQLEPDYFTSFKASNQQSRETIFAIPYDSRAGTVGNYLASMTYHYEQKWALSAAGTYQWCGNGIAAQPGLYLAFDEHDVRRRALLIGPQIDLRTGSTIIMPASGNPLVYTEAIGSITEALQNEGARLGKYEDREGDAWERDYDLVLMRYAEVLLMQAECNLRLGNAAAARPFVEQVRTRAGLGTPERVDLALLDQELRREFVFEGRRRTDNIRFGTFFQPWWEKDADAADKHTGIFPIPQQELNRNNKLVQNKGY